MAPIKSGTYRIVHVFNKMAITVPAEDPWTIIGWPTHEEQSQQWFVQPSGEGYHIQNCVYGNFVTIDSTEWPAKAYLGQFPPTWQILQDREGSYVIQYGDSDRVLNMHPKREPNIGNEIHIQARQGFTRNILWKFERLGDRIGDQDERTQREIEAKNEQIAAKNEQLAERDRLIAQLGEQLAQRLAEKDEELVRSYRDLGDKLAWVSQRENALRRERDSSESNEVDIQTVGFSAQEDAQSKIAALGEKLEEIKRMVAQMVEQDAKKPNNML